MFKVFTDGCAGRIGPNIAIILSEGKFSCLKWETLAMSATNNLTLLDRIRHRLNPVHVYCRLTEFGLPPRHAKTICEIYEVIFFKSVLG